MKKKKKYQLINIAFAELELHISKCYFFMFLLMVEMVTGLCSDIKMSYSRAQRILSSHLYNLSIILRNMLGILTSITTVILCN